MNSYSGIIRIKIACGGGKGGKGGKGGRGR
jgi:hypothetical protein